MRKYIALIITLITLSLMTFDLNAQSGRGSGLQGTGLDGFIEQADLDSIHIGAGKFIYGATGSGQDVTATGVELNYLDITTLGTGASSKAVVLDGSDNYTWPATGLLTYWGTAIDATGAELNILDGVSATYVELNYLDITTLGTGVNTKAVVLDGAGDYEWESGGILTYAVLNDGTTTLSSTALEMNVLAGVTPGTSAASKAVVLDASSKISTLDMTAWKIGGVSVTATASDLNSVPATTATAAELNYLDLTAAVGLVEGTKAVVLDAASHIDEIRTAKISIGASGAVTEVTATATELNYLDIGTLGTGLTLEAVIPDGGDDYTWPSTGIFTYSVLNDGTTTLTSTVAEINVLAGVTGGTRTASKAIVVDGSGTIDALDITALSIVQQAPISTSSPISTIPA